MDWSWLKKVLKFILMVIMVVIVYGMLKRKHVLYYCKPSNIDVGFKESVRNILSGSKWKKYRSYSEVDNEADADIVINLATREELDKYHTKAKYRPNGKRLRFSITTYSESEKSRCHIDAENWMHGVEESGLTLMEYRKYIINHEFGHGLGYDHQECRKGSGRCPVMYQSTRGAPEGAQCGFEVTPIDITRLL